LFTTVVRLALAGVVVALAACGDDEAASDAQACDDTATEPCDSQAPDSGPNDPQGGAGGRVWMPDSGTNAGSSGSGGAGTGGSSGSASDAGTLEGRMCAQPRMPLPQVLLPRCTAATRDCIAACMSDADPEACREGCIMSDATAAEPTYGVDCAACIYLQLFACVDQAGCRDGVAEVFCCIADQCPAGSPEGCGDMRCPNQIRAALTCGYLADQSCVDLLADPIASCFPPADDEDAGT
jgi:hypothetical protein